MCCYQVFEQSPFFYIESGVHMNFNELFDSDELVVFVLYNIRMTEAKTLIEACMNLAIEHPDVRFLMVHLDALDSADFPVSDFLEYEYELFDVIEEEYSFTLNLECFHLEPEYVVSLRRYISIERPLFTVYESGRRLSNFSNLLPGHVE